MPKISVLLPVYNTNPIHLKAAIDSVLAQTFCDFEFIIYNDASINTDIESIVKSYQDKRIRYIYDDHNSGIAKVRNKLISLSHGEYLAVMDHDDICLPDRFDKQIAFMDSHPEVGVCGTAYRRFGKLFKNNIIRHPENDEDIRTELFFKNAIHHPSAMIRRQTLIDNNISYDDTLISANDRKLYVDISEHAKLHNLKDVLCLYRVHKGMTSKTKRQAILAEQMNLRIEFLRKMNATISDSEFRILNDYIMMGRTRIKIASILTAIEHVLQKLIDANSASHYLPVKQFQQKCAEYLIKRCNNAAIYGAISSKTLLKETEIPIKNLKKPIILKLINFIK
jgi:glycosyltransferase involved in cell wall biosynthesis